MEAADRPASAHDLRDFLAGARGYRLVRTRVSDVLYRVYLIFGVGGFYAGVLLSRIIAADPAPATGVVEAALARGLLVGGAAAVLVALVRVSTWAGPVMVGREDAAWLLPTPVDRRALLRPHLAGGLAMGAAAGASIGLAAMLLLVPLRPVQPIEALVTGVGGGLLLGVLAAAAGWFVESRFTLARHVYRQRLLSWLVALGLGWLAAEVPVSIWLGPWGWTTAGLVDASVAPVTAWPAALLLAAAVAALVAWRADLALPTAPDEELNRRAGLYGTVSSSLTYFDARTIADAYDAGVLRLRRIPRFRVPPPPSRWLLPLWIDVVTLLRRREAVARSMLSTSGAIALVGLRPQAPVAIVLASVLAYFGAAPLVEQLRRTLAQPGRVRPVGMSDRAVVLLHLVVPCLLMLLEVVVAVAAATIAGRHPSHAVAGVLAGAATGVAIAVLIAAVTATRGPVPLQLMSSGGAGSWLLFAWFALGPLLAVALLGLPAAALSLGATATVGTAVRLGLSELVLLALLLLWRAGRRLQAG